MYQSEGYTSPATKAIAVRMICYEVVNDIAGHNIYFIGVYKGT